nr:5-formyltetrahydrofolate cyclo-ligase [Corynebacterium lactis]
MGTTSTPETPDPGEFRSTLRKGPLEKGALRKALLENRARRTTEQRRALDESLRVHVDAWLREALAGIEHPVIAAYVPAGDEPGATDRTGFLRSITAAAPGARLLLPVCPPGPPQPLRWGFYRGELVRGRFGLSEPVPATESLPPSSLSLADAALLPALAANPETGLRIGRGAGYYDRSLPLFDGRSAVVIFSDEIRDDIPGDAHDIPADAVISDAGFLRA